MASQEALKRVQVAADAVEENATRLQIKTEAVALDAQADQAKEIVHDVREAIVDINEDTTITDEEQAAKITAAAAAVEDELKEMADELEEATAAAEGDGGMMQSRPSYKSSEQAVKELQMLAQVRNTKEKKEKETGPTTTPLLHTFINHFVRQT